MSLVTWSHLSAETDLLAANRPTIGTPNGAATIYEARTVFDAQVAHNHKGQQYIELLTFICMCSTLDSITTLAILSQARIHTYERKQSQQH
jgi:hypothetical protein